MIDEIDAFLSGLQGNILNSDCLLVQDVVRDLGVARDMLKHLEKERRLPFSDEFVSKENASERMALALRYCQDWATSGDHEENADLYEKGLLHMLQKAEPEVSIVGVRIGNMEGTEGEVQLSNGATLGHLVKIEAQTAVESPSTVTIKAVIWGERHDHAEKYDQDQNHAAD